MGINVDFKNPQSMIEDITEAIITHLKSYGYRVDNYFGKNNGLEQYDIWHFNTFIDIIQFHDTCCTLKHNFIEIMYCDPQMLEKLLTKLKYQSSLTGVTFDYD